MADANNNPQQTPKPSPLRVGIIGLGPRWHKLYKPALQALRDRYQISAVCDQVQERATREARRLGCPVMAGPTALVQRPDTDALLLIDPQWFRLWPVQAACRQGKPCFCCDALERDDAHADAIYRQVRDSSVPVMMALTYRFTPAALALQELLANRAADVRLLLCSTGLSLPRRPRRAHANRPGSLPCSLAVLDWCTSVLPGTPSHVLAAGLPDNSLSTLLLRYGDGRTMQINRYRVSGPVHLARELRVMTDCGTALVRLPDRIRWSDGQGMYLPRLRHQPPVAQTLLEQFHTAVTGGRAVLPDLAHVYRLLSWLRLAVRSYQEGRWFELPGQEN